MSSRHGADPGERRGGRQPGSKNKATLEHENLISRAMAKEQAEAARAGDKEAQQKRVYYQGTLETDKANYRALARRAGRRCLEHEGRMPVRQPCHSPR